MLTIKFYYVTYCTTNDDTLHLQLIFCLVIILATQVSTRATYMQLLWHHSMWNLNLNKIYNYLNEIPKYIMYVTMKKENSIVIIMEKLPHAVLLCYTRFPGKYDFNNLSTTTQPPILLSELSYTTSTCHSSARERLSVNIVVHLKTNLLISASWWWWYNFILLCVYPHHRPTRQNLYT